MKKLIALLLAVTMMVSVIACGEGQKAPADDMKNPAGETQEQEEPKETAEPESTEGEAPEEPVEGPLVLVKQSNGGTAYREFIYDKDGRIVKERTYSDNELKDEYIYTYTEQADGKTLCLVQTKNPMSIFYELTYNAEGNCIKRLTYYPENGNKYSTNSYVYDSNGRLLCDTYIRSGNTSGDIRTYTYDENGNMLTKQEASYTNGNVYSTTVYTYNEEGDICKSERDSDAMGDCTNEYKWSYSEEPGKLVKVEETSEQKYTYEYDKDGNILSVTVKDKIAVLPPQIYVKEGYFVDLCEYSEFVLMPLSRAQEK